MIALLPALWLPLAFPQDETPAPAPTPVPQEEQQEAAPSPVAASVDDHSITEAMLLARFDLLLETSGVDLPPEQRGPAYEQTRPRLLDELIDEFLLERAAKKAGVDVAPSELRAYIERDIESVLLLRGMTREELSELFVQSRGVTLEVYLEQQLQVPALRALWLRTRLVEAGEEYEQVTAEQVRAKYDIDAQTSLSRPATVRASHILIETNSAMSEEARAEAKARAEAVLALARAEGADFAALAKEHSEGPSGPGGGDLGFFPRTGAMVEPFAAAAFALEVDGVSDLVETQFGYHIIRCTDRKEAFTVPFETAQPWIRDQLRLERASAAYETLRAELREAATIEMASAG